MLKPREAVLTTTALGIAALRARLAILMYAHVRYMYTPVPRRRGSCSAGARDIFKTVSEANFATSTPTQATPPCFHFMTRILRFEEPSR
jgi:hypothetical protein